MGLDMYLHARRWTSEYIDKEANDKLRPLADQLLPPDGNMGCVIIQRDVAYWRKANQIHSWFVNNVQEGNDDCGTYNVSREELEELRDTCLKVLGASVLEDGTVTNGWALDANGQRKALTEPGKVIVNPEIAHALLPRAEGFFFGSKDYDEWYVDQLKDTVEMIDKVLAWIDAEQALTGKTYSGIDLQYHSSW
jgi:hypothetical protein